MSIHKNNPSRILHLLRGYMASFFSHAFAIFIRFKAQIARFFSVQAGENKSDRFKRVLIVIVVGFWGIGLLKGCLPKSKPVYPLPQVVVHAPVLKKMTEYVTQTGTLVAFNTVDLVARVEGYLYQNHFVDGSFVKKDQLLFVIEPEPYLDQLKEAQDTVLADTAIYEYDKIEYERQQRMYKQNATALNSVQEWATKVQQSKADLDKAKANADNAAITYGYTHVKAPFDGRIGRHLVDVGNLVGNGAATKLATLEQIDPIYAYFNLNELDVMRLREAAHRHGVNPSDLNAIPAYISLQGHNDFKYVGHLNFVNTGLNASTGTLEFRALLTNHDFELLPGLFVQVRVPIGPPKDDLTIPATAIQYDQIGAYVMVVDSKNMVVLQRIVLGATEGDVIAVKKGLAADDRVIVSGLQNATPGNPVQPIEEGKQST